MEDRAFNYAALEKTLEKLKRFRIDPSRLSSASESGLVAGGYGVVRPRVLDKGTSDHMLVAVKELRPTGSDDARARIAFRLARELRVWKRMKHPNVLRLIGFCLDQDMTTAMLISPFELHGHIADYVRKNDPDEPTRLGLVLDTAEGLAYLHGEVFMCHGDLKAQNVLVNVELRAVLCDFGLTLVVDEEASVTTGLTTSKNLGGGTMRYISPELLQDESARRSKTSDIWSWGCLLVEILQDVVPYEGLRNEFIIIRRITEGMPPAETESMKLPVLIKQLLRRCWNIKPFARPTIVECREELRICLRVTFGDFQGDQSKVVYAKDTTPPTSLSSSPLTSPNSISTVHPDNGGRRGAGSPLSRKTFPDARPGVRRSHPKHTQNYDRLDHDSAFDRTMAAHSNNSSQILNRDNIPAPGSSSSYRYGWLSSTNSPAPSRPHSGDVVDGLQEHRERERAWEQNRSSPIENNSLDDHETSTIVRIGSRSPDVPLATSPAISATSSQDFTDEGSEGSLKPGERAHLMSLMGSDNDADEEGSRTMKPRMSPGETSPVVTGTAKRISMRRARAKSVRQNLAPPLPTNPVGPHQNTSLQESDEHHDDEKDDAEHDAQADALKIPKADDDGYSTITLGAEMPSLRGRGPSLTLHISPVVDDRPSPVGAAKPHFESTTPTSVTGLTPTSTIDRRASFRRDTWAFRPSAEDVYERLQEFFPDHDLDKPVIEPASDASSTLPSSTGEVRPPAPAPIAAVPAKNNKFKHRKSIRFVAEERKKALEKIDSAQEPSQKAAMLARKRSTKLWGSKVEELTPGQVKSGIPPPIRESPRGVTAATIKWVKGELIGQGTYAKVFLALNVTTGEMLAVKQVAMPRTISDQDDDRQGAKVDALKAERETLELLDHPNIVQCLGFEQTSESVSLFLEYVAGGSVRSCLQKHGKFEEQIVKSFTGQILDGLAYLHDNKILHRDVKADNILVDPNGICKISDFGISVRIREIYNNAALSPMQGSLFWMAPEVLHNNKKGYSAKVDIWSLGCLLIEMFAGRRPWEQDDFVSVMFKVGNNRMAPPVPEDVTLSTEADDFRLKCFTQDPDQRPSAGALRPHAWLILPRGWTFPGFR